MNKFIKKATSVLCSAFVAASTLLPVLNNSRISAMAYSNAQKFVDTAIELDYISGRTNEATLHYGVSNCDWCAMFVHLSAYRCGLGDKIPKLAYCDNQYYTNSGNRIEGYRSYYEKKGQFLYQSSGQLPKVGDLIVFETNTVPDGKADHIGIVTGVDAVAGYIYTIEGNGGGDMVRYKSYSRYDTAIIGYCQTMLDSNSSSTNTSETPTFTPSFVTSSNQWQVTSSVGCNLRTSPDGNKLGIISTGTILNGDTSKNQGEWIYVKSAVTETGTVFDGYVHYSTVSPVNDKRPVVTTATTTKPVTTTTTTATSVVEPTITTTVSQETTPSISEPTHYISSLIGANGRTSASFGNNIAKIVDTDTALTINYYQDEFANCTLADTGETYFIHTSTISELSPDNKTYTTGARPNYYVSSDCGLNLRTSGNHDGDIICILDTYQELAVLTAPNEYGFVYIEFTINNTVYNGYVHIDYIEKTN